MIEIRALKYNYRASGIVRYLQEQHHTIYRKKARLHGHSNLVLWHVSIPGKYYDRETKFKYYNIVLRDIRDYTNERESLKSIGHDVPGFGWALILSLRYFDSSYLVYQEL